MQAREGELFRLEAGPFRGGELRVESFRGREAVSRPYRWDISVDAPSEPPDVIETALLAQPARLDISLQGDAPRLLALHRSYRNDIGADPRTPSPGADPPSSAIDRVLNGYVSPANGYVSLLKSFYEHASEDLVSGMILQRLNRTPEPARLLDEAQRYADRVTSLLKSLGDESKALKLTFSLLAVTAAEVQHRRLLLEFVVRVNDRKEIPDPRRRARRDERAGGQGRRPLRRRSGVDGAARRRRAVGRARRARMRGRGHRGRLVRVERRERRSRVHRTAQSRRGPWLVGPDEPAALELEALPGPSAVGGWSPVPSRLISRSRRAAVERGVGDERDCAARSDAPMRSGHGALSAERALDRADRRAQAIPAAIVQTSAAMSLPDRSLRVFVIHGLEGSPQGARARDLAARFAAHTPAMNTSDLQGSIALQARALANFTPDAVVGSSYGGARNGRWRSSDRARRCASCTRERSPSREERGQHRSPGRVLRTPEALRRRGRRDPAQDSALPSTHP